MNKGYVIDKSPNATEEQIAEWEQMVEDLKKRANVTVINQKGKTNIFIGHIENLKL